MIRSLALALVALLVENLVVAQDTIRPVHTLKEVVVPYLADKLTPVTFQNISSKELDIKSVGQEPSFILNQTPSITNYSDAGHSQGYSYFRMRGIDQTRINISLDGVITQSYCRFSFEQDLKVPAANATGWIVFTGRYYRKPILTW